MDLDQATSQPISNPEKRAKENSSAAGNHGDSHLNGMSNGYDLKKEHKSEHRDKDKERPQKSEHKDKDRSKDKDKERSHKSEHRDKDRHKHSSSSSKDKDKHSSRDKDKIKESEKEKKSSSSSSRDKDHKSSSTSSKDKDRDHHKSSSSSKDKESSREKEKHKSSSSSSSRDKDKTSSKDKDKDRKHSSDKDKDRHSSSHSTTEKDKHRSSDKDKHRHDKDKDKDKDKDRRRQDKERSKHRDEKKDKSKDETKVKVEPKTEPELVPKIEPVVNQDYQYQVDPVKHQTFDDDDDVDDDSGGEQTLYIKEEDDGEEEWNKDATMDSTDANDTRLSDLHNTTIKTEEESEEDVPLWKDGLHSGNRNKPSLANVRTNSSSSMVKRKIESSDEEDIPLSSRKKVKKETAKLKKKKRKHMDDEDEEENDYKQTKVKKKTSKTVKSETSPRKKKEEESQEVWKWWEEEKKNDRTKWNFLEHKGPVFAPDYEPLPQDVKFYYNGKEMKLKPETEEVATFYARMLDHDYTTKKIFNTNFFTDWRDVMTESERSKIMELSKCNFKEMHAYFLQKSEERKAMSKEEKKKIKEQNEEIQKEYGFCTIDGHKEKIGNFKIEPPGLFRGRGEHPKMGKLKKRVIPEDVLINCSKDSVIPKPPPGHKWREVRHDPNVTWLASWTENVQGQVKYVMLNPSSKLKGEKDWQKYEIARKLAKSIDKIRAEYREDWKSKEMRIRQRAVALYFIDKLALRAGNEKDEDQADTVGCCSLRVEHISLHEHKDGKDFVVVFDFLGKDSIRYYNEVPVEKRVFKNVQLFMENKSPGDDLFDRLNTTVMNKHLNELMEGLTAKVFRTYNASWTLQQQLEKLTNADDTVAEKILAYNRANRAVAILCNHQRAVPKTHAKSMENLKAKIVAKKEAISEAEMQVKDAKRDAKHGSVKEKVVYEKKKKMLDRLREQLARLEVQATDREENKEIALGTSKLNYLDPRISVAWCKKYDVPIEKIYNKTQRDKFRWAIDMAGPEYIF
ncbi:DNA topoisomerase I, mitochondrial isoform X2 [Neodiprion pinetum]|uniref:DNA topoisomerase I n=1 Tax=Neodiprion lecontei TaxID=441921 RepID=A0ABM3FG14_NEOLC|nr:DNA topoisomerase I, mitochondrial isoform X2 [Neodiprion pinetum]XP_046586949.1 DNA topoisomerase I, mitochondrial isoform X2 [Neodiprion lecontei]XP_046607796.1 DNA topoisomerase I, mitochondrial isoform X2 [Neodiprion virginianus]